MKMNSDFCFMDTKEAKMHRKGGSILTISGNLFWPLDARASEVRIEDAAHALSMMCRFAGHLNQFYSVAQHSVLVSELIEPQTPYAQLVGLTHDVSEAYLVDIPRPIKKFLPAYKRIESKLQLVVAEAFNINRTKSKTDYDSQWLKDADNKALAIEAHNFVNDPRKLWSIEAQFGYKITTKIDAWTPDEARKQFMKRYKTIMHKIARAN